MGLNKVQIKATDESVVERLKRFLRKGMFDCINEDALTGEVQKRLLYPTDDFYLTKDQFATIKRLLRPNENLNLLQMGFDEGFFSLKNIYYQMDYNIEYQDYHKIWVDSISVLFPDSYEWIVLIDEAAEGGLGMFIASEKPIKKFTQKYTNLTADVIRFVEFFASRKHFDCEMQKYMLDILRMCK